MCELFCKLCYNSMKYYSEINRRKLRYMWQYRWIWEGCWTNEAKHKNIQWMINSFYMQFKHRVNSPIGTKIRSVITLARVWGWLQTGPKGTSQDDRNILYFDCGCILVKNLCKVHLNENLLFNVKYKIYLKVD